MSEAAAPAASFLATATAAPADAGAVASAPAATAAVASAPVAAVAAEAAALPAVYDFKIPEGVEVDATRLDSFKELCKAQGLTPAAAQAMIDWQAKDFQEETQRMTEMSTAWADALHNDLEIGGKNLPATQVAVSRVADRFFTPEVRQLFNESGLGNHPEVVRVFARIGATLAEDRAAPASVASAPSFNMFPKSFPGR